MRPVLPFILLLVAGDALYAQKTKTTTKPATVDTVILQPVKDSLLIPFEPYETNYKKSLELAKGSKERTAIFKTYNDALFASALTTDQKKALLRQKIEQYIQIDFYSLYEYFLLVSKEKENAKPLLFINVFRSTATSQQWSALTEYMKYATESAQLTEYNQTTGQTEQLKRPSNWPAGLPYPGYGWGKYLSTDDVATPVSMQYHLPAAERYRIISQYKKEGKKISPDDQAWCTVYELNAAAERATAAPGRVKSNGADQPGITRLIHLVGHYYYYNSASQFDCTTCKVTSYTSMDEIVLTCKYGNTKKATFDELVNNKGIFGFHPAQLALRQCKACNGNGVVKSSFSHTNDYQYTLGKKITYTSTTITNCIKCGGSGYIEERF
ncbi:MAG: hypothetical protein U0V75_16285 [Ferruginibacter sp.]